MIEIKGLVEPKVSGLYRTRGGEVADIKVVEIITRYPDREEIRRQVTGIVKGQFHERRWSEFGLYMLNIYPLVMPSNINVSMPDVNDGNTYDLVEYLGEELPKQKKVVKMAPALVYASKADYKVSHFLFKSEDEAKELYQESFVRWLIDTPYAVEVEVPDNG